MGRLFLHEYISDQKTAQVYRDLNTGKFWVLGFQGSEQWINEEFITESSAEDFAEDWTLQPR